MKTSYGKAAVSVYRTDGVRRLLGAEIEAEVFGEAFAAAYTEGDNSMVVPTDTMKNVIHDTALEYEGDDLDGLLDLVGDRFLASYEQIERLRLHARELPFAPEGELGVLFRRLHDEQAVAELELDRSGVLDRRAGIEGLQLIKITGSAFASFARDEHTTLPEMIDRPLFIYLDVHWRCAAPTDRIAPEQVRSSTIATFDEFVSMSIQHLVHEMGRRLLEELPALAEVSFRAENRLWDTACVSETDPRTKVYTDPRPPYGVIRLTLTRD